MTRPFPPAGRTRHDPSDFRPAQDAGNRLSLVSLAVALTMALAGGNVAALTLGRINVMSALGEPLRAEIDVDDLSAVQADSLRAGIASPEAFQAAGVPYSPALADVRASLLKRADGRYVVRLNGTRALNDPFIDVLIAANWSSGRVVRDYTVLLDPPALRQAAAPRMPVVPQYDAASAPRLAEPLPPAVAAVRPPPAPRRPRPLPTPTPAAEAALAGPGEQVTVRPGDTASRIASAHRPAGVSLDQMLGALLRANPDAFIDGDINRIKAGAVLAVPGSTQAGATGLRGTGQASQDRSHDSGDARRHVDSAVVTAPRDRLTISQGAPASATDKLAPSRQVSQDAQGAESPRNASVPSSLQAPGGTPASGAPAAGVTALPPVTAPAASAVNPAAPSSGVGAAAVPAPDSIASPPAATVPSAPGTASAPSTVTSAPAASPAAGIATPAAPPRPKAAAPAPAPVAERGFLADLLDNPLVLGAAALIAALLAFLLYRVLRQRRGADSPDSVFLESRMPRESFFGVSGGQQVDTSYRTATGNSTMSFSSSQLDAGDVDPVAEADVYLAYGRDLQAEEILREAMRTTPERVAIPLKLLEIHAKRRDARAFEALAGDVRRMTGGTGPDWARAVELGRELDPGNPMYQADPVISSGRLSIGTPTSPAPLVTSMPEPPAEPPPAFVPTVAPLDFDLELSKPAALAPAPVSASMPLMPSPSQAAVSMWDEMPPAPVAPVLPRGGRPAPRLPVQFDHQQDVETVRGALDDPAIQVPLREQRTEPAALQGQPTQPASLHGQLTEPASLRGQRTEPATLRDRMPGDSRPMDFDVASLSGYMSAAPTGPGPLDALGEPGEHPHAVKLSLARELQAIGDTEGARSLVDEVISESSGDLQAQARRLLVELA